MISAVFILAAMVLYLLLLFGIAHYADKRRALGRSIVSNPYVYALSLCVYCTAWTFYGSIGRASTTGLGFLPIYLGPTLVMLLGWSMIRKMIRISKEFHLTSISDFISFRYGRSYAIGAIVTLVSLMVITPYVALQLIAISNSIIIIGGSQSLGLETKLTVAFILGVFAMIFGARHLDPMERHEGLIAAVAFESIVKLVAFLAAGVYITYFIFNGYGEIIDKVLMGEHANLINIDYVSWLPLTIISASAIIFLPRQFHVMVVENSEEKHLKTAMWLFPLYLLLINLFVPAIAGAGLLLQTPGLKDMFIVSIPTSQGQQLLALLVFIGGASAATAMVLVESVAVGTMMLNELEMPHLMRWIRTGWNLPKLLLNLKRFNILMVMGLGYLYARAVEYQSLADIGLVSFLAASQMAPAALGGLYWRKGTREGAIAGLISGFLLWTYTALLPTLIRAGWFSPDLLTSGPFGIALLRPMALFGMEMDVWSHSAFWSLLANCSLYVLVSLMSKPSSEEIAQTNAVIDIYEKKEERTLPPLAEKRTIRIGTLEELEATMARYIGPEKAKSSIEMELARIKRTRKDIDARGILELWDMMERTLTGSVGPSATRMIVEEEISVKPVMEMAKATRPRYVLEPGRNYVAPKKAYEIFTDQITHGLEGLCITVLDPDDVRRIWGFKETPIIRLSHAKGKGEKYISPTNLPLLFVTMKAFVESSTNSIILLDSLEHLIKENASLVPEEDVLDFVNQMEHLAQKGRTRFILSLKLDYLFTPLSQDVETIPHLIFSVMPLPSYLLKLFIQKMIFAAKESYREDLRREIRIMLTSGELFAREGEKHVPDASCDPDMISVQEDLEVDPNLPLTRRQFLATLRRLEKIAQKFDPQFYITNVLSDLLKKYGFSPYEVDLLPGTAYVIEESKPTKSLKIYSELVSRGMDGLCISRYHPNRLQEIYAIPPEGIIWLTQKGDAEGRLRSVDPSNFPRLSSMLSEFLAEAKDPLILIEGVGYLITQSNYETVLRFIQSFRDEIALRGAILLVHVDPLSLDIKELHRLESEMEPFVGEELS